MPSQWFENNSPRAYGNDSEESEPSYNCGYGEYFNVDSETCKQVENPMDMDQFVDATDLVEVEFQNAYFADNQTEVRFIGDPTEFDERLEPGEDWDEEDPGQSEYEAVMDDMMQFEMQTQGKNFKDYVWWGINRDDDDWDSEIELLTYIYAMGYNYYTYDPRPE